MKLECRDAMYLHFAVIKHSLSPIDLLGLKPFSASKQDGVTGRICTRFFIYRISVENDVMINTCIWLMIKTNVFGKYAICCMFARAASFLAPYTVQ